MTQQEPMETSEQAHQPAQQLVRSAHIAAKRQQWPAAVSYFRQAIHADPASAPLWLDLGMALQQSGQIRDAIRALDRAACLAPDWALAWLQLGRALRRINELETAVSVYQRLLQRIDPAIEDAHTLQTVAYQELGILQMTLGQFPEAWSAFEWRFAAGGETATWEGTTAPIWDGRKLDNEVVMVWTEQGLGDHLQFCRFANQIQQRGGRVWLQTPEPLQRLYGNLPFVERIIHPGQAPEGFDWQIPLMSIPGRLRTDLNTIPDTAGYLAPSIEDLEIAKTSIGDHHPLKVGLVWASQQDHPSAAQRDIPVELLAQLAGKHTEMSWFSLQFGERAHDIKVHSGIVDLSSQIGDFARTAAYVQSMDLVITVDTAMTHLAGALGQNCFTLLNQSPDWRWFRDRNDSPWYQHHRLFRQQQEGDWSDVINELDQALYEWRVFR